MLTSNGKACARKLPGHEAGQGTGCGYRTVRIKLNRMRLAMEENSKDDESDGAWLDERTIKQSVQQSVGRSAMKEAPAGRISQR
jgi:hypothetical protein